MKKYSLHLLTVIFLITGITSFKKETNTTAIKKIEADFADNDMVMYWNERIVSD